MEPFQLPWAHHRIYLYLKKSNKLSEMIRVGDNRIRDVPGNSDWMQIVCSRMCTFPHGNLKHLLVSLDGFLFSTLTMKIQRLYRRKEFLSVKILCRMLADKRNIDY